MTYKQYDVWLANLNPTHGTEPGKVRPVVIIQTNLLNDTHVSTIVCPITTNVQPKANILRVHLKKTQLPQLSDILVDQPRAIDNASFIKKLSQLTAPQIKQLKDNLKIVLDL